jgi:mannitol-specific phosphotransferase system IIBC component
MQSISLYWAFLGTLTVNTSWLPAMNLKNFVGKLSVYFSFLNSDTDVRGITVVVGHSVGKNTGTIPIRKRISE